MSFNMKNNTLKVFASISSRVFQFLYTISIQMDFCGFFFHFFHMVVFCIVNQTFCQPMTWIYWYLNNCAMNWNWNSVRVCYMARSVAHTHTHVTLNYMCGLDMDRGFANLQNEIICSQRVCRLHHHHHQYLYEMAKAYYWFSSCNCNCNIN